MIPHVFKVRGEPLRLGFTLVELLASIAIVAILASLLFALSGNIMDRVDSSKSRKNLRDLQMVNLIFANENNGDFMPAWQNSPTGGLSRQWFNQPIFHTHLGIPLGERGNINWPAEYICPKAEIAQESLRDNPSNGAAAMARSYGYNIEGNDVNWGTPSAGNPLRKVRVVNPSETIAFADALDWLINASGSSAYSGKEERTQSKMVSYRHNGAANVVFFDGHVEELPREDLDVEINPENMKKWKIPQ